YYHFALRLPGGRFAAAYEWLRGRVEVLEDSELHDRIFVFDGIRALACYFHDPASNIVELIAYHDLDAEPDDRPFDPRELLGVAEIGLVAENTAALEAGLRDEAGIEVWSGTTAEGGGFAFAGARGHSLILCPAGRPWLPLRRPAEVHP